MRLKYLIIFTGILISIYLSCGEKSGKDNYAKGKLIYENSLETMVSVQNWRMEGPGELHFADGWMHMYSPNEEGHHVYWCPQDFPESFIAEWEAQNIEIDAGLCIIFFAARGEKGQDIFDPGLPVRDGTFKQYTQGEIISYHISYYANAAHSPDLKESHLRKNNTFSLVQSGGVGIPTGSTKIHKLTLIKKDTHIIMYVDERKIIDWVDDGVEYGKTYKDGKIGFRQMKWTHFRYRNFKVWDLSK